MWFFLVDWSGFAIPCKWRDSPPIANLSTYLPHRGEHLGLVGKLLYSNKPEGSGLSGARQGVRSWVEGGQLKRSLGKKKERAWDKNKPHPRSRSHLWKERSWALRLNRIGLGSYEWNGIEKKPLYATTLRFLFRNILSLLSGRGPVFRVVLTAVVAAEPPGSCSLVFFPPPSSRNWPYLFCYAYPSVRFTSNPAGWAIAAPVY